MDYRLIRPERALENVDRISAYIALDSPKNASRLVRKIFTAADQIKRFPRMGRVVPEFKQDELRDLIVWPYRIV